MSQDRNRNNSMHPIPNLRDDYYVHGPSPAFFNEELKNNCLFQHDKQYKITSNNHVDYDSKKNSISQFNFKQNEYENNNLLDNNINENIKENYYKNITLVIDSIDRDINIFPNSLQFKVLFNPVSGSRKPYINKKIKNIKSINMQKVMIPNFYLLEKIDVSSSSTTLDDDIITILNNSISPDTDTLFSPSTTPAINGDIIIIWYNLVGNTLTIDFFDNNDTLLHEKVYSAVIDVSNGSGSLSITDINSFCYYTYKVDNPNTADLDRFLYLEIEEFKNINEYSTNDQFGYSFGCLYQDTTKCNNNICFTYAPYSKLIFPSSELKNISSLTFRLYNSVGDILEELYE